MRVAFVAANRERLPDPVIPVGLLYVMANTPGEHERELVDLCFEPDPLAYLRQRLASLDPEVVAVGLRNVQNNDYTGTSDNLRYYQQLLEAIRACTASPVVLGGGGFSVMPRQLMGVLGADYGIRGEGERAFAELLRCLESHSSDLSHIPNLHYRRHGELLSNPAAEAFLSLDDLMPPDRGLVDRRYYEQVGVDSIQTKRGCPLTCDYCTYPLIEGRRTRQRHPAAVVDELEAALAAQPSTSHFFVVDSVFNVPPEHAKAVCREMIGRGLSTPWTCYANPIGFDRELAELLVQAGCAGLEIGSDSGCDAVLDQLRKGFRTADILAMHELCRSVGLPDCHTFVLGTPGEDLDHVRETLAFLRLLSPFAAILMIWTDDCEALAPGLTSERHRLRQAIKALLEQAQNRDPHWVVPPLGINFDPRLFGLLRRRGLRGPLWQHLRGR